MNEDHTMAAEAWFARLRSPDCTSADRAAFNRWCANENAARAYDEVVAIWDAAGAVGERPPIRALRTEILAQTRLRASRRRAGWGMAAAAAALAMLFVAQPFLLPDDDTLRTAVGEQKTVTLEDGSTVTLDTASILRVNFTPEQREITLEKGQAYFEVARRPGWPFTVAAGDGKVTAIGTAFAVRRDPKAVTVTLASGVVAVTPQEGGARGQGGLERAVLKPNEQMVYTSNGMAPVQAVDVATSLSWARGDIVFRKTPLSDAVAEINRYTTTQLTIRDPSLSALQINGVFHIADVETFLLVLNNVFDVEATGSGNGNVVFLKRKQPQSPAGLN